MNILLTGGAGYLGSVLSRQLLERGHNVRVLDRLMFGRAPIEDLMAHPGFHLIEGDIRHVEDVTNAVCDVDMIVDLAAIVGAPACEKNGEASVETNFWATKLLADVAASKGVDRLVFASTCSVYGPGGTEALDETSETNPLSLYAETKLESEKALLDRNRALDCVVLRLATLCGPSHRMRFDLVLNIMTAAAAIDKTVRVFGGGQWRPLLDVRDAACAFTMVLDEDRANVAGRTLNVGENSRNFTMSRLAEVVASQFDEVRIDSAPDEEDARSYRVVFDRFREIGYRPQISMEQSVNDVADLIESKQITDYKNPIYRNSSWTIPRRSKSVVGSAG